MPFFWQSRNNPVGTVVEPELLEKIAERCQKYGVTTILDECFVMFTGAEERYSFLKSIGIIREL